MPDIISPKNAAFQHRSREEDEFNNLCNRINTILVDRYGLENIIVTIQETRFIDRVITLYGNAGWKVDMMSLSQTDALRFSHQPEGAPREPMVIEDEYMRVELVPVDQNGSDVLYGDVRWTGSSLRVTIKRGVIADAQPLNVGSQAYINLVMEEPTVMFSMVEPNR